jgi:hypothetical protein
VAACDDEPFGVIALATWLRDFHAAAQDFRPPPDCEWFVPDLTWRDGQIVVTVISVHGTPCGRESALSDSSIEISSSRAIQSTISRNWPGTPFRFAAPTLARPGTS